MPSSAPDSIWFDKLTSPEVDALDRERTILVLPTGCTEQQGPHLPIDADTFQVSLFLSEAARRARQEGIAVYLLPTLPYGPAEEHMAFAGTITMSFKTHHRLVKDVLHSLARHGFRRLLVAMGCGGHHCLPPAMEARAELRQAGVDAKVWVIGPVPPTTKSPSRCSTGSQPTFTPVNFPPHCFSLGVRTRCAVASSASGDPSTPV